jgi:hypothetical protein
MHNSCTFTTKQNLPLSQVQEIQFIRTLGTKSTTHKAFSVAAFSAERIRQQNKVTPPAIYTHAYIEYRAHFRGQSATRRFSFRTAPGALSHRLAAPLCDLPPNTCPSAHLHYIYMRLVHVGGRVTCHRRRFSAAESIAKGVFGLAAAPFFSYIFPRTGVESVLLIMQRGPIAYKSHPSNALYPAICADEPMQRHK